MVEICLSIFHLTFIEQLNIFITKSADCATKWEKSIPKLTYI